MPRTRLRQARIEAGLTQEQLADVLHVERKAVARWEKGTQDPQPCHVPRIRDILKSTDSRPSKGMQGQALIRKADAARLLGDMDEVVACLTNGFLIATQTNSQKRLREVHDVMHQLPENWQKETKVQHLQKEISQAIICLS
jgi:transcriptional regulator with XRE-family HTH domain